jgi:hypothetical protein
MRLKDVINALAAADQNRVVPIGFGNPASYRGDYYAVAFSPVRNTSVASMLKHAESALGETFCGYKGGQFEMNENTECYICNYGESGGDRIGPVLLEYLTGVSC